jgi:hypothetical protein
MNLSRAREEAWEQALEASSAIEESSRLYGRNSEEVRLARAAFEQWKEEYLDLTNWRPPELNCAKLLELLQRPSGHW